VIAFSDAVIAIAVTLLVLEIGHRRTPGTSFTPWLRCGRHACPTSSRSC
jgi:uncharacterized membrane protein